MNKNTELEIYKHLAKNPEWITILKEAMEVEEKKEKEWESKGYGKYLGWEWYDVHASPSTLNSMVVAKLLNVTLSTHSGTHYLVNYKELVRKVIQQLEGGLQQAEELPAETIPDDLFDIIIGYDDVKQLAKMAINSEKPVHILFSGPPASAKTMFLMELHRLPDSYYALAPSITEAGLSNILFTYEPKYLIIDEIDRMKWTDIGQLNSLMATGEVVETKYRKTRSTKLSTKVFAAGIRIEKLPSDLLSRFITLRFKPYTYDEFVKVAVDVIRREGVMEYIAKDIADKIWNIYHDEADVRRCIYVARMVGNNADLVDGVTAVIKKYKHTPMSPR